MSQDEARFPMVPALTAALGVKGHRPEVGTWDCKDLLYVYASVNCVDGRLHTRTLESPKGAKTKTGKSKSRRMQEAFVAPLADVARAYPAGRHPRVVLVVDNAPWHKGRPVKDALARHPHLELKYLPSYSPKMNVIERLGKALRKRSTHNRLFDTLRDLRHAVRSGIRFFQLIRSKLMSLIEGCYTIAERNRTASAGV